MASLGQSTGQGTVQNNGAMHALMANEGQNTGRGTVQLSNALHALVPAEWQGTRRGTGPTTLHALTIASLIRSTCVYAHARDRCRMRSMCLIRVVQIARYSKTDRVDLHGCKLVSAAF